MAEQKNFCEMMNELFGALDIIAAEAEQEEKEEERAVMQEQFAEGAELLYMAYESYVKAGFSETQAFNLLLTTIGGISK